MSAPTGSVTTGQTSSRSTLSVQPSAISRAPKAAARASAAGSPQRSRRRSTTSHGRRSDGAGEVVGQRVGDGRQVRRRRQDRGVIGVVRGTEEDRGRGRRDRRQVGDGAVAHLRVEGRVVRARPRGGASTGRSRSAPPRAQRRTGRRPGSPRGRWPGRRPTRHAGRPSPRTVSTTGCAARANPRWPAGCRRSSGARRARGMGPGPRSGRGRPPDRQAPRQASGKSRSNATPDPGLVAAATSPQPAAALTAARRQTGAGAGSTRVAADRR